MANYETVTQKWRVVAVTVAMLFIGCLLIRYKAFMNFVWMNAAAFSLAISKPHCHFSVAVLEVLACLALIWKGLWAASDMVLWFFSRHR